eukprot:CAMPEP_0115618614 /NCGR_PEP_ID=MMETSP0272-20121206/24252_1 /TAXON_ID=71861 /ORGANISM="Scrippsiella trochoidea, Strain CCMP3099" /LENGTH=57 /DNA_ID=CAMNT_0003054609 /DNA_START=106 /DNA_END=275 /DNA_ORIENTATION=-
MAPDLLVVSQGQRHLLDLIGQLARGRQYEALGGLEAHVDALQAANHEGGGLARARLR